MIGRKPGRYISFLTVGGFECCRRHEFEIFLKIVFEELYALFHCAAEFASGGVEVAASAVVARAQQVDREVGETAHRHLYIIGLLTHVAAVDYAGNFEWSVDQALGVTFFVAVAVELVAGEDDEGGMGLVKDLHLLCQGVAFEAHGVFGGGGHQAAHEAR